VRLRAHFSRVVVVVSIALSLLCTFPTFALAWANGPQYGEGFGTHDWILYHANQSARQQGYDWVDWPTAQSATDDPDMVLRDFYYHVYDRTGDPYGDSPKRVSELYSQAVGELRSGDRTGASRTLGLLSHYLSDTANPLHTDQTPAETSMHSRYEDALDEQTGSPEADLSLLIPHTASPTRDVAALTRKIAASAHGDYFELVGGYNAAGNSPQVEAITARSLNLAVAGVADTIAGISVDAGAVRAADAERGAGSPQPKAAMLPTTAWCVVGMALGLVLTGVLAAVVLLRRRKRG
jgi:hypothetical protein